MIPLNDTELLARYVRDHDPAAFAALVRKHGGMVFATCRRIAANAHDAEDAFQASFLVLASRAEVVRPAARLGAWLYGVAVRCARKARDARLRLTTNLPPIEPSVLPRSVELDLAESIDDALVAIPEIYRAAVVLCHLEGRSRREAARELGWTEGTLSGRLHRGLEMLAKRLTARGVTATAVALSAVLSTRLASAGLSPTLAESTCSAATLLAAGFQPPASAANSLATRVMHAMSFRKLKVAAAVVVLGLALGAGSTVWLSAAEPKSPPPASRRADPVPVKQSAWEVVWQVKRKEAITAVAANKDRIAVADAGCELKLYDPADGVEQGTPIYGGRFTRPADRLRFAADGRYLMMSESAGVGGIIRYQSRAGSLVGDCLAGIDILDYSADLHVLVKRNPKVRNRVSLHRDLWTVEDAIAKPMAEIEDEDSTAIALAAMSPDGTRLVTANADRTLKLWEVETRRVVHSIKLAGSGELTALRVSDDGGRLIVHGEKGFATVFDAQTGKEVCELKGHEGTVTAVAFASDGSTVATANGKTLRLFEAKTGKRLAAFVAHDDDITALAVTPDGKRLVSGSKDKTVKVWQAAD